MLLKLISYFEYIFTRLYDISGIGNFNTKNLFIFLFLVLFVFVIEYIIVGKEKSSFNKIINFDKSARTDIVIWLVDIFNLYTIIAFILSLGICYYLSGVIQKNIKLNLLQLISNGYIQFGVIVLIADFKNYIKHRIFHKIKPLWRLHAFHHSATSFTILTRYRGHFLEMSISRFFDVLPFVIFGAPIYTYFLFKLFTEFQQLVIHSNVSSNWGFIGKYILISPTAHRIHHSEEEKHFNKNFGTIFVFWDKLFGSFLEKDNVTKLGIPDNIYNKKNIFYDIWITFVLFFKELLQKKMK